VIRRKLKKVYGMPPEHYVCPICNQDADQVKGKGNTKNGPWVIDHCHETESLEDGFVTSVIEHLAGFDDNKEILRRAI
jgi:ribosomal protein L37AE/L43A